MDTSQVESYIQQTISQGSSVDHVRQTLLNAGWQQSIINPLLTKYSNLSGTSPLQTDISPNPTAPANISKRPTGSLATKVGLFLLICGIVLIATYILLLFVGKSIFIYPKTPFSQKETSVENLIGLTTTDNPYRSFLNVGYSVKGVPFGSQNKLFDYTFSITNSTGKEVSMNKGTYDYSKSSSNSENKTSLSFVNSNITLPLNDFEVIKNDTYKTTIVIAIPQSLDPSFTIKDWSYEIKGKVIKPPLFIFIIGIVCVLISILILYISNKIRTKNQFS